MIKSFAYSLITKALVGLINFSILLISSRYLGVASRGEISIFLLNIVLMQIINEVYTGYSIIHFIPKFDWKKLIFAGLVYTFLFCTLSNTVIVFIHKQVEGYEIFGYILSLLIILNTFNCVLILGKQGIRIYNVLCFIQPFLLLIGILVFVIIVKDYTFSAYFYPLFFSFLVAFCISSITVYLLKSNNSEQRPFHLKPIIINGLMYQLSLWMFIFNNRYSYYLLPDKVSVGLYASASSIIESVLIISNALSPVLLTRLANTKRSDSNAKTILTIAKVGCVFSIVLVMILCLLPETYILQIMGNGFVGISDIMKLYAPGVLLAGFFTILSNYFIAKGQQKVILLCYSIGFLSSLILAPIFVSHYGIKGAAYSADIAYLLTAISVIVSFGYLNRINMKQFFSFSLDYQNLKSLIAQATADFHSQKD